MSQEPHKTSLMRRRVLQTVLLYARRVLTGTVLSVVAVLLALQIPPVSTFVARLALSRANPWPGTVTAIGSAGGTWLSSLSLTDVVIASPADSLFISIDTLRASYDLSALFGRTLHFRQVSLSRPVVRTSYLTDGTSVLLHAFASNDTSASDSSKRLGIRFDNIRISDAECPLFFLGDSAFHRIGLQNVEIAVDSLRVRGEITALVRKLQSRIRFDDHPDGDMHVGAAGELSKEYVRLDSFSVRSGRSHILGNGFVPLPFSARSLLLLTPGRRLALSATPLAYEDLHHFIPSIGPMGEAMVHLTIRGERDSTRSSVKAVFPGGGRITAQAASAAMSEGALGLTAAGMIERVSPSGLTGRPDTSESITARFAVRGAGRTVEEFTGTLKLDLLPSRIAGIGPLKGSVNTAFFGGRAHTSIQADVRAALLNAEADLAPFDAYPSYDLRGSLVVGQQKGMEGPMKRLAGLAARFNLNGKGLGLESLQARALLNGTWNASAPFRSIRLEADCSHQDLNATLQLVTAEGSLHASAEASLFGTPSYRMRSVDFRKISLASFGDGLPVSSLTGSLQAEGRGTALDSLSGRLSVALDSSRIAHLLVKKFNAAIAIDRGRVRFTGNGQGDAGLLSLQGSAHASAEFPSLELQQCQFGGIDLGRILDSRGLTSDLNGSVELHAASRSLRDVTRMLRGDLKRGERVVQASGSFRLNPSRINQDSIQAGTIGMTLLDGDVETTLEMHSPGGGAYGKAQARPFGRTLAISIPAFNVKHLDLGSLLGTNTHTDLTGLVRGALEGDSLPAATGDLAVTFLNSTTSPLMPTGGSLRASLEKGCVTVSSTMDFMDGRAALEGDGQFLPAGLRGKITLQSSFAESSARDSGAAAGARGLAVQGVVEGTWGRPAETDLRGQIYGGGTQGSFRADTLLCRLSVHGRVLDLDTLRFLTNVASVTGGGTIALFDSSSDKETDFSFAADVTSLQPLESLLGLPSTALHRASLSLRGSGPPGATRVIGETSVESFAVGNLALGSLHGSADLYVGSDGTLKSLEGTTDIVGFSDGSMVVSNASASVHSIGNTHDIACLVGFGRGSSMKVAGTVRDEPESLMVRLDTLVVKGPSQTWTLERPATISYGARLDVRNLVLKSGPRDIIVEGVLDPNGNQDFTVSADSLDIENVGKLFGRPGLDGLIFTHLRVAGPATEPRAVGDMDVMLASGGQDLGRLSTQMDWKARSLQISGTIDEPNGGSLVLKADLPVAIPLLGKAPAGGAEKRAGAPMRPLDVLLTAESFNLGFFKPLLSPETISELGGTFAGELHLSGKFDSLAADGQLSIDEGRLGIAPLGAIYSGIQLRCAADGQELRLLDTKATSGGGGVQLEGRIGLENPREPVADIKVALDRFVAVQTPNIKAVASGELALTGKIATPTVIGNLLVNDSYYVLPEAGRQDSLESVELTPEDYAMLQRYFGYSRPAVAEAKGPSTFDPSLDLTVTMQKNDWFRKRRNPTLAIELQGSVQIERRPGQSPRLNGLLRCPEGRSYVGQFGRQFELTEGEIQLKGPVEETELHINSEYKVPSKGGTGISEVVIRMKVETKLGRFIFSLTSDPAMDESEILSYLATGQSRTGALANTGDQGGLAGAMALEQLVGVAGGITEGSMPLDVFQIRQDGARGITIVAGNYVSPKTYLGIRQPILFNQGTEDTYYDTRTQYELEYQAQPWLFMNLQGGSSRTLLFLKARVAY